MKKRALVLSGGSIKGAFQAGAVRQVLREGFQPDIVHGISVGSLNGSFIVNETGKRLNHFDWKDIGKALVDFWKDNINKPSDLVEKKGFLRLAKELLFNHFNGIISTEPLQALIKRTLSVEHLRKSLVEFTAGAVDMITGKLNYFSQLDPALIEGIIASTAIPIMMPISQIGSTPFYDGGLRDVAPLKSVIDKGADEIVIILCQSEELSSKNFNTGKLTHLASRIMDIVVNETVNNDIAKMQYINELVPDDEMEIKNGIHSGKKKIKYRIIRPSKELIVKIDQFKKQDIEKMIALGEVTAFKSEWME
ncbi:MAG: patatin-like phospholipase family protein [Flavobacteriales bacterium]|nr:patatin-like phospholipase family protein [Flavobacteriales bacterium]